MAVDFGTTDIGNTVPVSAASLPLPTGATTEATLALIKAKTDNLDVLLSTRTKPADTQAISAVSLPLPTGASTSALQTQPGVDIGDVTVNNAAGDAAVNVQDGGNVLTVDSEPGTLNNGVQVSVTQVATQLVAANANRKKLIVQVIGNANIRVGTTGITNTTGFHLEQFQSIIFDSPNCPTNAIFAIRENNGAVLVMVQEIV